MSYSLRTTIAMRLPKRFQYQQVITVIIRLKRPQIIIEDDQTKQTAILYSTPNNGITVGAAPGDCITPCGFCNKARH